MSLFFRVSLLISVSLFLSGCGGNWLVGKWSLDQERTLQVMSEPKEPAPGDPGKGLLQDIVGGLQKGLSRVILTQFEGVQLEFTSNEFRRLVNGTGESQGYKIIDRPDSDTYVVQYADGDIVTWNKVDSGIRLRMTGDTEMWIYFEAVK